MNKYGGDIPEEHRRLIKELQDLESWFDDYGNEIEPIHSAKGMTCIAHDYYHMFLEEEGERILRRAEKIYPDYFKKAIYYQAMNDTDFAQLVRQLHDTQAIDIMLELGFVVE